MDQTEKNNPQSPTQFITSQYLKKITQLLLSVSLLSFIISFKFQRSILYSQLLSHTFEKNCIFLIFNGILVFLAKSSGFNKLSPASEPNNPFLDSKESVLEREVSVETSETLEKVGLEKGKEETECFLEEESEDSNMKFLEDKYQYGKEETKNAEDEENSGENLDIKYIIQEGAEDGLLSEEDLDKKFDDFIRRMKEEFRMEAQEQQLVMAY